MHKGVFSILGHYSRSNVSFVIHYFISQLSDKLTQAEAEVTATRMGRDDMWAQTEAQVAARGAGESVVSHKLVSTRFYSVHCLSVTLLIHCCWFVSVLIFCVQHCTLTISD